MLVVLALFCGFVGWYVWANMSVDTESVITLERNMKDAFEKQQFVDTVKLGQRILAKEPKSTVALLFVGQGLIRQDKQIEALDYLTQVVDSDAQEAAFCHLLAGQILCNQLSQFREGEKQFRRALHLQPQLTQAYKFMEYVLRIGTRTWELIPFELRVIEHKEMTIEVIDDLSRNERLPPELGFVLKGIRENPDDPNILLGHANFLRAQQKYAEAEPLLRKAVAAAPEMDEAHVRLGQVLWERGEDAEFVRWQADVQDSVKRHPFYWVLLGRRAQNIGELPVAARCYWEAIKIDPNLQEANYQLGLILSQLGRSNDAKPFLDRAAKLNVYIDLVRRNKVRAIELGGKGDPELAQQAIKAADELGNLWEAYAWVLMTLDADKQNMALQQEESQMEPLLKNVEHKRTLPPYNPTTKVDLSKLPLPDWKVASSTAAQRPVAPPARISFENQASAAGIKFEFVDGHNPQVHGLNKMYQMNGGGVGVIDFDRDGWPDMYFTQGSNDPQDHDQTEHLDKLFRNLGDGRFADVTAQAGLVENSYSQGVTIGDVDNDGFPDIFVANVGANRLYLNNGDGTFTDATEAAGVGDSTWTSSCVIADFNGDSLPDIYTVGFIQGDAITRICNNGKKRLDPCVPLEFPIAKSHLWLNRGDGRFEEASAASGIELPNGKGTAVVAADVTGSGKLDLLIGNQGNPNFLLKNAAKRGDRARFVDQGMASGFALGFDGSPRFSFGLAAGDFNGDGLLDVHGTSTTEEPNTLFLQKKNGIFTDAVRSAGLFEPTYLKCSFGTQTIDGDLDGKLDLFVVHGNVDDISSEFLPYEMPPAYYKNDGTAHFTPVPEETLGPYFKGKYLGRSAARLDWNRDGREDVAISNLRSPAALLTNTTPHVGHHLTLRLVSTKSARDAIGTTVELTAGDKKLMRQLTAGDGFQASNERILVFGLGEKNVADAISVSWPSGQRQKLSSVPGDQEILLVEGRGEPVVLRRK
jgi:tetratricopeptide (TPR) repeat protein